MVSSPRCCCPIPARPALADCRHRLDRTERSDRHHRRWVAGRPCAHCRLRPPDGVALFWSAPPSDGSGSRIRHKPQPRQRLMPNTCIGNSATFRRPSSIPRSTAYALGVPRAQRLVASVGRCACPSWSCRFASEHAPLAAPARSTCALAAPISVGIARPTARCRRLPNREAARAHMRRPRPDSAHAPWSTPTRHGPPDT